MYAAQVSPEDIGYIETHGTATQIGDPIEIEALTKAFHTTKRNYCALGSVKNKYRPYQQCGRCSRVLLRLLLH